MSIQLFFFDKLLRLTVKRRFRRNPDVMELRNIMAELPLRPAPAHVSVDIATIGGIKAERLRTAKADKNKAVLYIHGGGFVGGVPGNHRPLTWRLAEKVGVPIYAIDYRLAPEHPYPAGLDDCVAAYRGLLDRGIAAKNIVIAGDSAGGNFTLTSALKLKSLGVAMPAALVALSPATDIEGNDFPSRKTNERSDAMFAPGMFASLEALYCPDCDRNDPFLSPYRGDVAGFPPTLIHCSDTEMLRDDGVKMAEKLRAAGVPVTLEVWPKVFHVWQAMADMLPEARASIGKIAAFMREKLAV